MLIVNVDLFYPTSDQENADQVKAEADVQGHGCKLIDFFNFGHHLRNSVEHTDSHQQEQCPPYQLNGSLVIRHMAYAETTVLNVKCYSPTAQTLEGKFPVE
jgi:hypothetical protein